MVEIEQFDLPMGNRDFADVRIGIKGLQSTSEDMKRISHMTNITANVNWNITTNDTYDAVGETSRKSSKSPSVEVTFIYDDSAVHKYILDAGMKTNEAGVTQLECDMPDGSVLSMLANIELQNFGPNGAPGDDAEITVNFTYALGDIVITPKAGV